MSTPKADRGRAVNLALAGAAADAIMYDLDDRRMLADASAGVREEIRTDLVRAILPSVALARVASEVLAC